MTSTTGSSKSRTVSTSSASSRPPLSTHGSSGSDSYSSVATSPTTPLTPETKPYTIADVASRVSASPDTDQGPILDFKSFLLSPPGSPTSSLDYSAADGITPRAEISQPVWPLMVSSGLQTPSPLSAASPPRLAMSRVMADPASGLDAAALAVSLDLELEGPGFGGTIKRGSSLAHRLPRLDTSLPSPTFRPGPPSGRLSSAKTDTIPALNTVGSQSTGMSSNSTGLGMYRSASPATPASPSPSASAVSRRGLPAHSPAGGSPNPACSSKTGCSISAPISPPEHYPIPMSASSSSSSSASFGQRSQTHARGLSASTSSLSTSASTASSSSDYVPPTPPRWACPPASATRATGRARSFGTESDMPDIDFGAELLEGTGGDEEVEVIQGNEGRIAVRSTKLVYEIMVWLPGFTLDNITIATRGVKTVHIVADQWEAGDHAQWDIKLGDDANMRSISAKFGGQDLKITVAREQRKRMSPKHTGSRALCRPSVSTPTTPSQETANLCTPVPPVPPVPPRDIWASQWSPHPMTRRVLPAKPAVPSTRTV